MQNILNHRKHTYYSREKHSINFTNRKHVLILFMGNIPFYIHKNLSCLSYYIYVKHSIFIQKQTTSMGNILFILFMGIHVKHY